MIPAWLLTVLAWSVEVLGVLVLVALFLWSFWQVCEFIFKHLKLTSMFLAFMWWRDGKRRAEPTLAKLLDEAEQEEREARAEAKVYRDLMAVLDHCNRKAPVGIGDVACRLMSKLHNCEWEEPDHDLIEKAYGVVEGIKAWEAKNAAKGAGR